MFDFVAFGIIVGCAGFGVWLDLLRFLLGYKMVFLCWVTIWWAVWAYRLGFAILW